MKSNWKVLGLTIVCALAITAGIIKYDDSTGRRLFGPSRPRPAPGEASKPPLKSFMIRGFRNDRSLLGSIGKQLARDDVPWQEVASQAAELRELIKEMSTLQPLGGSAESWQQHTYQVEQITEELEHAARKQDRDTARSLEKKLTMSCKACHDAHRGTAQHPDR
jgi:hypothetical protein